MLEHNPSAEHILKLIATFPCRLAQGVRSKDEPEESFLKGIPADAERLEIIYPVSALQPFSNNCWHPHS